MKTKLFTITLSGNIASAFDLCERISESEPNFVSNGSDFAIVTINSATSANEIKDYLAETDRTIIVTEMGEHGAVYFSNPDIAEKLYQDNPSEYTGRTVTDIIDDIAEDKEVSDITEHGYDFDNITSEEAMVEIEKLIGNGKNIAPEVMSIVNQLSEIV